MAAAEYNFFYTNFDEEEKKIKINPLLFSLNKKVKDVLLIEKERTLRVLTENGELYFMKYNGDMFDLSSAILINVAGEIPKPIKKVIIDKEGEKILDYEGNLYFRKYQNAKYDKIILRDKVDDIYSDIRGAPNVYLFNDGLGSNYLYVAIHYFGDGLHFMTPKTNKIQGFHIGGALLDGSKCNIYFYRKLEVVKMTIWLDADMQVDERKFSIEFIDPMPHVPTYFEPHGPEIYSEGGIYKYNGRNWELDDEESNPDSDIIYKDPSGEDYPIIFNEDGIDIQVPNFLIKEREYPIVHNVRKGINGLGKSDSFFWT